MAANYWLVKQEPEAWAWSNLVREGETAWTEVRSLLARNHLRAMRRGDWSAVDLAPVTPVQFRRLLEQGGTRG